MIAGPRNKSGSGLPSSQGVSTLDHHLSDHDDPDDHHHHYRHLDDDDQVGCCGVSGPEDWQHTAWGSGHQVIILIIIMMTDDDDDDDYDDDGDHVDDDIDDYDDDGDNDDSNDYNDNDDKSQERLPHSCCYSTTKGNLFISFDHIMMISRPKKI